jgi:hypothetical protein
MSHGDEIWVFPPAQSRRLLMGLLDPAYPGGPLTVDSKLNDVYEFFGEEALSEELELPLAWLREHVPPERDAIIGEALDVTLNEIHLLWRRADELRATDPERARAIEFLLEQLLAEHEQPPG